MTSRYVTLIHLLLLVGASIQLFDWFRAGVVGSTPPALVLLFAVMLSSIQGRRIRDLESRLDARSQNAAG